MWASDEQMDPKVVNMTCPAMTQGPQIPLILVLDVWPDVCAAFQIHFVFRSRFYWLHCVCLGSLLTDWTEEWLVPERIDKLPACARSCPESVEVWFKLIWCDLNYLIWFDLIFLLQLHANILTSLSLTFFLFHWFASSGKQPRAPLKSRVGRALFCEVWCVHSCL